MKIGLVDVDGKLPNLALMRLSAYHKLRGDEVVWYDPLPFDGACDIIYASKIFTYTPDYQFPMADEGKVIRGGTGYDIYSHLPEEIENTKPDYSIYPAYKNERIGFLTRGCIRNCPWCVVPRKEGKLKVVATLDDVSMDYKGIVKKTITLYDNNFLAAPKDFVISQFELAEKRKFRIDFNQALDCRLVDDEIAEYLAKAPWQKYMMFSCDTDGVLPDCIKAIEKIFQAGYKKEIQIFCLAKDASVLKRINALKSVSPKVLPFVMPFRDLNKGKGEIIIDDETKNIARWCNRRWIFKSTDYEHYKRQERNNDRH